VVDDRDKLIHGLESIRTELSAFCDQLLMKVFTKEMLEADGRDLMADGFFKI
jgi:hypothetical protein